MLIYDEFKPIKIKWWERLLLWFKPVRYSDPGMGSAIKYKILFGRMFILAEYKVPFHHVNCRCHIEEV